MADILWLAREKPSGRGWRVGPHGSEVLTRSVGSASLLLVLLGEGHLEVSRTGDEARVAVT